MNYLYTVKNPDFAFLNRATTTFQCQLPLGYEQVKLCRVTENWDKMMQFLRNFFHYVRFYNRDNSKSANSAAINFAAYP